MGGCGCVARGCGGELEVPVGIVLDDYDVVFGAESVEVSAALEGEDAGGWVLAHAGEGC